jgi:dihydrofolate reductase
MVRVIYETATSFDGFIADAANSLDWLFAVDQPGGEDFTRFMAGIGVIVQGSTTYEWVLHESNLLEEPDRWQQFYGARPTFVFSSRDLRKPDGADIRLVRGPVAEALPAILDAADGKNVWVVGGGDLAGQFLDADALNEVGLSIAPVALGAGAPLLPRRIESNRLRLVQVEQRGQFARVVFEVAKATP